MKVLVTGASGQLGYDVCRELACRGIEHLGMGSKELDITDPAAVEHVITQAHPAAVVHCAAFSQVDLAETHAAQCRRVNVDGTRNLARVCGERGIYMIYISTDYVFNGEKDGFYSADDPTDPLSVYGRSKRDGELAVLEAAPGSAVVRTSWLFGHHCGAHGNFVESILRAGKSHKEINVVSDQIGSPTFSEDLARLLVDMTERRPSGIFQATNEGICSRSDFARRILHGAAIPCAVKDVSSAEYPSAAKRPLNSRLGKETLDAAGLERLPPWENALERYLSGRTTLMGGTHPMNKTIVVTGAGGYIGRHVVSALCDMGATVIAVGHHMDGVDARAKRVEYDIFSGSENIYEELGRPDACLHMAWKSGFVHDADVHMEKLSDHYSFLMNLIRSGIKQIAVMGTMHEIGYHEGAINENTPCNPSSLYGIAKDSLRRSMLLQCKKYGVCLQWLRAYYIYGDDKKNNSIFAKLMLAAEEGKETFPFTSGKNLYDFIHVDELSRQIACTLMQTEVDGIINCCTGKPVSLADKVEEFIRDHGYSIRLDYGAYPDRAYDSPGVWGDASKIRQIMSSAAQLGE